MEKIGSYAFIIGVAIAIIMGLVNAFVPAEIAHWIPVVLVVLGLIVGFLNIHDAHITDFLIAAIAVSGVAMISNSFVSLPIVGMYVSAIVDYIAVLVAPAALIVGLKRIWTIGRSTA